VVGCIVARVAIAPSGVTPWNWKSHSRSCLGRPVHAQISCRIFTCLVVSASPSLKEGSTLVTGVSHVSFFSATSRARRSVVSAFVFDAIMKSESASTLAGFPRSFTPYPSANTTLPPWTMPTATPGIFSSFMPVSTKRESSASRAGSSGFAFFPANDSRT
jgi:hypothetical protein